MRKSGCTLLLMFLASTLIFSQEIFKMPENPEAKAEQLKQEFSTDQNEVNLASLQTTVEFDFRHVKRDYSSEDFHTYIDKVETNHFITLEDKVKGYVYESYNRESSITDYGIKIGSNLRKAGIEFLIGLN